ncbi:MAG TPA: hypothetical protein VK711_07380 [Puia sp.]|jgi:hypothetical protein|nr:hypothetical protein [Puia sp.]
MLKGIFTSILFLFVIHGQAQLGIMKMVGKNTNNYSLGFGAYVKGIFSVSQASDVTLELGANLFFLNDGGSGDGTALIPIKAGYRYSLNGTGLGFYVEPQIGYNIYGVTSANVDGTTENLTFHGVVLAAGTGYLFLIGNTPLDLNLHYETIIDHGGSDNYISLGLSFYLHFGKRDSEQ